MNKEESEKNIKIVDDILNGIIAISLDAKNVYEMLVNYAKDAKYFHEKGEYLKSIECSYIVWAYTDALLHLGKLKVKEEILKYFTV